MTNVDEMPMCAADWLSACGEDGQMEESQPINAEENNQSGEGGWEGEEVNLCVDVFSSRRKACRRIKGIQSTSLPFITLVTAQYNTVSAF